jgi:hypothetical protein
MYGAHHDCTAYLTRLQILRSPDQLRLSHRLSILILPFKYVGYLLEHLLLMHSKMMSRLAPFVSSEYA